MIQAGEDFNLIATATVCSVRSVQRIDANLRYFGATKAPANGAGRRRAITGPMLQSLCDQLLKRPDMYRDEMILFLRENFSTEVSRTTITRTLKSIGWSWKTNRRVASQRDADLVDLYLHNLSNYKSYQLVFIDESGADRRDGHRRKGWAPVGVAPVKHDKFNRDTRVQVLPAYAQDGVMLSRVYYGSTDIDMFEDFIEELLHHCGRYPEPKSVLIMDNASWHNQDRIEHRCAEAGVKFLYLPPYSPHLNPIEEFFSELKAFLKRYRHANADLFTQDFKTYLEWSVQMVGARQASAQGHFRNSGISIEQPPA